MVGIDFESYLASDVVERYLGTSAREGSPTGGPDRGAAGAARRRAGAAAGGCPSGRDAATMHVIEHARQ